MSYSNYDGCMPIFVILGIVALIIFGVVRMDITTNLKRYEQLRIDAKDVDPTQAEDVIGQITAANQEVATYKYWNGWFLVELFIPDVVDGLLPIPVPKRSKHE